VRPALESFDDGVAVEPAVLADVRDVFMSEESVSDPEFEVEAWVLDESLVEVVAVDVF
jgi:hypothetical protein